jgi:hypothetical protein
MGSSSKTTQGHYGEANEQAKRGVREPPGAYKQEGKVPRHAHSSQTRKAKGNGDDAIEDTALTGHEIADNEDL